MPASYETGSLKKTEQVEERVEGEESEMKTVLIRHEIRAEKGLPMTDHRLEDDRAYKMKLLN